jgi:hypothetical protein
MMLKAALATAFVLVSASAMPGEPPVPEPPRVRVTSSSERIVGSLVRVDEAEVTIQTSGKGKEVRLKKDSITQFEVSRRGSNRAKGIVLGLLGGAVVGGVLGSMTEEDCDSPAEGIPAFTDALCSNLQGTGTGAGILLGAPLGAALGFALSHGERWESTNPDRLRLVIAPRKGGGMVRVSFRF